MLTCINVLIKILIKRLLSKPWDLYPEVKTPPTD